MGAVGGEAPRTCVGELLRLSNSQPTSEEDLPIPGVEQGAGVGLVVRWPGDCATGNPCAEAAWTLPRASPCAGCATTVAAAGRRGFPTAAPVVVPRITVVVVTGDLATTSGGGGLLESTREWPLATACAAAVTVMVVMGPPNTVVAGVRCVALWDRLVWARRLPGLRRLSAARMGPLGMFPLASGVGTRGSVEPSLANGIRPRPALLPPLRPVSQHAACC